METQKTLDRVEACWESLERALAGLDSEQKQRSGVAGEWSVKDILGHIAFWLDFSTDRASHVLRGEEFTRVLDWDTINDVDVAEKSGWSLAAVDDELRSAYENQIAVYRELSARDGDIDDGDRDHICEHVEEILAWRQRLGI